MSCTSTVNSPTSVCLETYSHMPPVVYKMNKTSGIMNIYILNNIKHYITLLFSMCLSCTKCGDVCIKMPSNLWILSVTACCLETYGYSV